MPAGSRYGFHELVETDAAVDLVVKELFDGLLDLLLFLLSGRPEEIGHAHEPVIKFAPLTGDVSFGANMVVIDYILSRLLLNKLDLLVRRLFIRGLLLET